MEAVRQECPHQCVTPNLFTCDAGTDLQVSAVGDTGNVFGESDEVGYSLGIFSLVFKPNILAQLRIANPRRGLETPGLRQRPTAAISTTPATSTTQPPASVVMAVEAIEMMPRSEPSA